MKTYSQRAYDRLKRSMKSIVKLAINYRKRGRLFYLKELYRPYLWILCGLLQGRSIRIVRDGVKLRILAYDNYVSYRVFIHGLYTYREQVDQFLEFVGSERKLNSILGGRRIFVEIGGNIGTHTICFAEKDIFGIIHSVEADPENYRLLSENIRICKTSTIVHTYNFALSDQGGFVKFRRSDRGSGCHRVMTDEEFKKISVDPEILNSLEIIDVPSVTFDDFVTMHKINMQDISMIWVDAEEHEGFIFKDSRAIKEFPAVMYSEYKPSSAESNGFRDFLLSNYDFFYEFRNSLASEKRNITELGSLENRATDLLLYSSEYMGRF